MAEPGRVETDDKAVERDAVATAIDLMQQALVILDQHGVRLAPAQLSWAIETTSAWARARQ